MLYRKHWHTIKSLSRVATFAKTMAAEEHRTCRTCRKMKEIQEGYDLLVRGGNAAARCSSMWTGTRGGENYCGNLLWQSVLTLLFPGLERSTNVWSALFGPEIPDVISLRDAFRFNAADALLSVDKAADVNALTNGLPSEMTIRLVGIHED